jgi:hypothetical protein
VQSDSEVCSPRAATVRSGLSNYITNSVIAFSGLQLYSSLHVVHSVCPKLGPFFSSSWTTCLFFLNYRSSYTTLLWETDLNKAYFCIFLRSYELFWSQMRNQMSCKKWRKSRSRSVFCLWVENRSCDIWNRKQGCQPLQKLVLWLCCNDNLCISRFLLSILLCSMSAGWRYEKETKLIF